MELACHQHFQETPKINHVQEKKASTLMIYLVMISVMCMNQKAPSQYQDSIQLRSNHVTVQDPNRSTIQSLSTLTVLIISQHTVHILSRLSVQVFSSLTTQTLSHLTTQILSCLSFQVLSHLTTQTISRLTAQNIRYRLRVKRRGAYRVLFVSKLKFMQHLLKLFLKGRISTRSVMNYISSGYLINSLRFAKLPLVAWVIPGHLVNPL